MVQPEPARPFVIGDTGVMLCAGGAPREHGLGVIHRRLKDRLNIPEIVRSELDGLRGSSRPGVRAAAVKMTGNSASFIKRVDIGFSNAQRRAMWIKVDEVEKLIAARRRRSHTPKPHGHKGEIDGILLALHLEAIFLSNDLAAQMVARLAGLVTGNYASLLAAEIAEGNILADEAAETCRKLEESGIDCGLRTTRFDALSLAAIVPPPGI